MRIAPSAAAPLPRHSLSLGVGSTRMGASISVALLCVVLAAASAVGQPSTATVTGSVADSAGAPLAGAWVSVAATRIGSSAHVDGRFRIDGIQAGSQVVQIELIGFRTVRLPVELAPGEELQLQVTLTVEPIPLEAVEAHATEASPAMAGFEHRRRTAAGHFFTRQEIDRMQPRQLTDVLRRVPGLRIVPVDGPFGTSFVPQLARTAGISGARLCPILFYVNGAPFPVAVDVGINAFIRPEDVAALEVYSGAGNVPARFNSSPQNARCGVVLIWMYAGEEDADVQH